MPKENFPKRVEINFLPREKMRLYGTENFDIGDYYFVDEDVLRIEVASDKKSDALKAIIAVHELVEALLLIINGKQLEDVDLYKEREVNKSEHLVAEKIDEILIRYFNSRFSKEKEESWLL